MVMGRSIMFFETDRLAHEERMEARVPTEAFICSKCRARVRFTARADEVVTVTCPKCGRVVEVVIESKKVA